MKLYGLIGHPVSHSFSQKYFTDKFEKEGITDCRYELFDLPDINALPELIQRYPELKGLNVTIPHKLAVLPYLANVDESARRIGAVNVIKITNEGLVGYNSDYYGFKQSLLNQLGEARPHALILGTGGASQAVKVALQDLNISYQWVSRSHQEVDGQVTFTYDTLDAPMLASFRLIINTTPLGTSPKTEVCPQLPYEALTPSHFLHDLVYNPSETLFMRKGKQQGADVKNGLEMLVLQAEKSWEIWNQLA